MGGLQFVAVCWVCLMRLRLIQPNLAGSEPGNITHPVTASITIVTPRPATTQPVEEPQDEAEENQKDETGHTKPNIEP